MIKPTLLGVVLLLIAALPWLLLLPLGLLWLWQHDGLLWWMGGAVFISLGAWLARGWWRQGETVSKPGIGPDPHWPNRDEVVWQTIETRARALQLGDYPLDPRLPHRLLDLGLITIREVAAHYYPDTREPELQVPLPHVLLTTERVCRDLRRLTDYVPLSHRITLAQWKRAPGLMKLVQLYDVWRLARLVLNPAAALATEARAALQGKLLNRSRDELMLWLLQEFVKGTGRHAIDLYSGRLLLDDTPVTTALGEAEPGPASAAEEPFRVLVAGQVSSGKSSLINALFGELRADTDVLAHTTGFVRYTLERDGLPAAVILDSQGYAGGAEPAALDRELLRADLLLLVCAAHHAGRAPDRDLLERVRALYRAHPERAPPATVCALSCIDRLRPVREWNPPYRLDPPDTPKARSIRAAVGAVAADLGLDPALVVPVRTDTGQAYNIDQTLVPRILDSLGSEARRARYLRCLRHRQQTENRAKLLRQAGNAGRLLVAAGERLWRQGRDWLANKR